MRLSALPGVIGSSLDTAQEQLSDPYPIDYILRRIRGIQRGYEARLSFDGKEYPSDPTVPPAQPLTIPAWARTSQPEQSREKLGSLTSQGEVYVNDSLISVMSTVFSGDKIRTGESGEATLAVAGKEDSSV